MASNYEIEGSRCLVTGGAGCIGSTIVDKLLDRGAERVGVFDDLSEGDDQNLAVARRSGRLQAMPRGLVCNLSDWHAVDRAFEACAWDYVFHAGGHLLLKAQDDPYEALKVNVLGTYNVLNAALDVGVKKLVFTSSISIFGEPSYVPVDEEHPLNNTTIYGATKICGEHMCRDFARQGLTYSIIRPYNVYGPRQSPKNGAFSQVVPRWIRCILEEQPIVIHGDGSQTADLVHVADMAEAHVLALEKGAADGESFNIGTGVATSMRDLACILCMEMGVPDHPIQFRPNDDNRVKQRCCEIGKARKMLGYAPRWALPEGLRATIAWWKEKR